VRVKALRPDRLRLRVGHQLSVGQRWRGCGVLQQPVEQQAAGAGVAAVESEAELVEVGLHVLGVDAALVGAQQPPLAQRGHAMDRGQQLVGLMPGAGDRSRFVGEPAAACLGIGAPAVGHVGIAS